MHTFQPILFSYIANFFLEKYNPSISDQFHGMLSVERGISSSQISTPLLSLPY
jgi:hypothetical protein